MRALLIAEKPSLRRILENVYNKNRSLIDYEITFLNQAGHIFTLKMPNELDENLKEWSWDTLPIAPETYGGWQYKLISDKKDLMNTIKKELNSGNYDFVIHAGDPDQEGQLLVNIVLSALNNKLPVKRYWSNDTTDGKVLEALRNLRDNDNDTMLVNLLDAAYARQHTDWRYGMNISRAASLKMGGNVSVGRVKTPILGIVCKREQEIANFKPTTTYGIKSVYSDNFFGQLFNASDVNEEDKENEKDDNQEKGLIYFDTREEAETLMDSLSYTAIVKKYETKKVETLPPKLYKLATAQVDAGKIGFTPSETLEIIQSLYEKGYISYPRTDCEYISSNENLKIMLNSANSVPALQPFIDELEDSSINKVKGTKKWVNDKALMEAGHSALTPTTKKPDFDSLPDNEKKIYELICRRFVSIFMDSLVQNKTLMIADIDGNSFKSNGKTMISPGYTTIYNTTFTDNEIPECEVGDYIEVNSFEIVEKTTTCPKHLKETDIVAICENPGKYLEDEALKGIKITIGTPATRADIIEELISKNKYLQRKKEGKVTYIIPTETGMIIYENLKNYSICKVDMTGLLENKLEEVRTGNMSVEEVEELMKNDVASLIAEIKNTSMDSVSNNAFKNLGICPVCGGNLRAGSKSYYCSNYKEKECKVGAFNQICGVKLKPEEFVSLVKGETITKELKTKDGKKWSQELIYDFDEYKVKFVQKEKAPQAEVTESDYYCPSCNDTLTDNGRMLKCSCGFTFWKTTCGVTLTEEQISNFFNNGSTGIVKGLKSKKGNTFDAAIILNEDGTGTKFKFD